MWTISREQINRIETEHRSKHSELHTYARLEWGGHTGWLRSVVRADARPRPRFVRFRIWARTLRPVRPRASVAPPAVLLQRVRIQGGLEIVISVGLPEVAGAGTSPMFADPEERIPPDLSIPP